MTKYLQQCIVFLIGMCFLATSCTKPTENEPKITQSNLVYEDNVNGRIPPPNNVIESTNFYYDEDGNLFRATVYDDTSATAHLLKEISMTYASDKVTVTSYLDTLGSVVYYIGFNNKKQVTYITLPDSSGLYVNYLNDRISSIRMHPSGNEYINFNYDDNDNLTEYETKIGDSIVMRSVLEYNSDLVSSEFDSRFLVRGIKFIYIGGLDLMQKLGLNLGKSPKNKLIRRNDILSNGNVIFEHYDYGYTQNSNQDIVKRNIMWSTDTLYYQFKY